MLYLFRIYCPQLTLLPFLMAGIIACSQPGAKKKEAGQHSSPASYKKPPSSFTDTLKVQGPAAVFFNPDSVQLQKIKAGTGEQVFKSTQHDCFFQQRNARQVLKQYWPQINVVEVSGKRFLLFKGVQQKDMLTDLDAINDMCGLILYKAGKKPEVTDMMNIETVLHYYFDE